VHAQRYCKRGSLQEVAFPSSPIDVHLPIDFLYLSIFSINVDVFFAVMYPSVHAIPAA
jgi:hypothetical protein